MEINKRTRLTWINSGEGPVLFLYLISHFLPDLVENMLNGHSSDVDGFSRCPVPDLEP